MPQLFSVSVVTWNQEGFLAEAIESALAQDYRPIEIVVSDDLSTDGTPAIVRDYVSQHPSIVRGVFGETRLGFAGNSNRSLAACRGEFVAFLGGDDVMCPGKLTAQAKQFLAHPNIVMSYHAVDVFDHATGRSIGVMDDNPRESMQTAADILQRGGIRNGCALAVRRNAVRTEFHRKLNGLADLLFQVEIARAGRVGWLPKVLGRYRRHGDNMTNCHADFAAEIQLLLDVLRARYPDDAELAVGLTEAAPGFVVRTARPF